MQKTNQAKKVISAQNSKKLFDFAELWRYKDLLYFMVLRDVTVLYKQTVLGFAWAILNPLIQVLIFSVVFGGFAGLDKDANIGIPYPLFSAMAVVPWTYFANSLGAAGGSLITTSGIFTKVYFPRLIIPLVPILSKLVDFFISFALLILLMVFYKFVPGSNIIFLPIPLIIIIISAAGMGFWLSTLSIQYRDFRFALSFLIPLLMYAAPVTYPASKVLEKAGAFWYQVYPVYPMAGAIEGFRTCFMPDKPMPWQMMAISFAVAVVIFISGAHYFKKTEKHFADLA